MATFDVVAVATGVGAGVENGGGLSVVVGDGFCVCWTAAASTESVTPVLL
jgi:hypothetical protein